MDTLNQVLLENTNQQKSRLAIKLLQGVVYREQQAQLWQDLLELQQWLREYLIILGLELIIDDAEGYAFLRQQPEADEDSANDDKIPKLIAQRSLSFPVSLLCVLLRKRLLDHDAGEHGVRVVLTRQQLVDLVKVFMPDNYHEAKIVDKIETYLQKLIDMKFLRRMKNQDDSFEVCRIIKAFVDASWLAGVEAKLSRYTEYLDEQ